MFNAFKIDKLEREGTNSYKDSFSQRRQSEKHNLLTNELAQNYYYRVADFAKEMLVQPQKIQLHHNNSGIFEAASPRGQERARSLQRQVSQSSGFSQEKPMQFGSYKTQAERVADQIVKNKEFDSSPSKRTLVGNEYAVLNLRPDQPEKYLARKGNFRSAAQTSAQSYLDRMNRELPLVLNKDSTLRYIATENQAEGLNNSPAGKKPKFDQTSQRVIAGTIKTIRFPKQPQPYIPHPELHAKTYFNALERILMAPVVVPPSFKDEDPSTWHRQKIFEYSMNRPPKGMSDQKIAAAKNNDGFEQAWFDNLIEKKNQVLEPAPINPNKIFIADQHPTTIASTSVLKQVLRQCNFNQNALEKSDQSNRELRQQALNKLTAGISNYYKSPTIKHLAGQQSQNSYSVQSKAIIDPRSEEFTLDPSNSRLDLGSQEIKFR